MSGRTISMARIAVVAASGWLFLLAMRAPAEGPVAQRDPVAAAAAFEALAPVLRNPRCMNCHSTGDYPRQGTTATVTPWTFAVDPTEMVSTRLNAAPVIRITTRRAHTLPGCARLASAVTSHADDLGRFD